MLRPRAAASAAATTDPVTAPRDRSVKEAS